MKHLPAICITLLLLGGCAAGFSPTVSPSALPPPQHTSKPIEDSDEVKMTNKALLLEVKKFIIEAWNHVEQMRAYNELTPWIDDDVTPLYFLDPYEDTENFRAGLADYYDSGLTDYILCLFGIRSFGGKCVYSPRSPAERYLLDPDGEFALLMAEGDLIEIRVPFSYNGLDGTHGGANGMWKREEMVDFVGRDATYTLRKEGDGWIIVGISQRYNDMVYRYALASKVLYLRSPEVSGVEFYNCQESNMIWFLNLHKEETGFVSIKIGTSNANEAMIYEELLPYGTYSIDYEAYKFSFSEDGYGNSGSGIIIIEEAGADIQVSIALDKKESEEGIFEGDKIFEYVGNSLD